MKMSDWVLLQTLYECRNLTKTASLLYLTQPTVTKRLQLLEEELGVRIADRSRRSVTFTPEGEYLAVKAVQINNLMREVRAYLAQVKEEPADTLHIGASNSFTRSALPGLLMEFKRTHPRIRFDISTDRSSHLCRLVEQGKLDLGFINGEIPFTGEKILYRTEQAYLASTTPLDMEHLERYPCITYFRDEHTQQIIEQWWAEHYTVPFPQGLKVAHGDLCREMILKGLGYGFFFVADYMADHPECIYPLTHKEGKPLTRNTWIICTPQSREKEAVRLFLAAFEKPKA